MINPHINCIGGYINEEDLIKQFELLLGEINLDEVEMKTKIKLEVDRFKKFRQLISNNKDKINTDIIDIKHYAEYILKNGTNLEKRELLECVKGQIVLKNKIISIQ